MKTTTPVRRMFDRMQRRFVRSRPGSVLILVVALLVLMALIGTAYISMAQSDRYAAEQHRSNTQVDLLVDGVTQMAKNAVVIDLFQNGAYRPASQGYSQTTGVGMDQQALTVATRMVAAVNPNGPLPSSGTPWLADRLPSVPSATLPPTPGLTITSPASVNNFPYWQYITAPLGATRFDTPYWQFGPGVPVFYTRDLPITATGPIPAVPPGQGPGLNAQMAAVWIQTPSGTYPALQMMSDTIPARPVGPPILAGDADGDGIADSGLVKLPIGTINGVTYYYAVRIIDNGAAVNASVAWTPNQYTGAPAFQGMPGDFFPVNIDLQGMLKNYQELYSSPNGLNSYRYGSSFPPGGAPPINPVDDNGNARTDFRYMPFNGAGVNYYFDQVWMQLGRRLQNPGLLQRGSNARFQSLGITDSMALAYKFCLFNAGLVPSTIEQRLPASGGWNQVRSQPFPANDPFSWFNFDFLYGPDFIANAAINVNQNRAVNNMPLRPVLVARNPVSNFSPMKFRERGVWSSLIANSGDPKVFYQFGDTVRDQAGTHRWVCITQRVTVQPTLPFAATVGPPQGNISSDDLNPTFPGWVYMPWASAPTKTNVNTASFGELWLAYWNTMCEQVPDPADTTVPAYPLKAMPVIALNSQDFTGAQPDWRMFRSPVRLPFSATATRLHPYQALLLRAALAAVNTIDLRDNDDDVTSRTITLPAVASSPAYSVTLYGTEMQPYITEVYAENKPGMTGGGYVAIELYNPYPKPIVLKNWKFARLDRTTTPMALTAIGTTELDTQVIPPKGYLVAVSDTTPPNNWPAPGSVATTPPATIVMISALADQASGVFNKELVLLRPRRSCLQATPALIPPNGTLSKGAHPLAPTQPDPMNNYDEGTSGAPNLYNFDPVDSYDFTGLASPPADMNNPHEWHYIRPNDATANKAWHFTYPGRYYPLKGTSETDPRQEGTMANTLGLTITPAMGAPTLATLGAPDATTATGGLNMPNTQQDVALQLNNYDFAGPNNPSHTQANTGLPEPPVYPLGGFMRNGDMLQVPFIGSYKISPLGQPTQILEMNSVTMDAAMATAEGATEIATGSLSVMTRNLVAGQPVIENVGRFCPVDGLDTGVGPASPNDFAPYVLATAANPTALNVSWRYHFATRLFDYLTVQSPQLDFTPEVDPSVYAIKYENLGGATFIAKYPPATANTTLYPQPVANVTNGIRNAQINNVGGTDEESAPIDGLVNVNTASWRVLAAVPWVPWNYGSGYPPTMTGLTSRGLAQLAIANSIVRYRDYNDGSLPGGQPPHGHGPFKNLFELGRVPIYHPLSGAPLNILFRDCLGQSTALTSHFDYTSGNLSPADGTSDNVFNDFESQFLMINRISNLVTTHSDSFTVYVLVQGWRDAETANPTLAVQRRAAFIVDRSAITPLNNSPSITPVPTD